MQTQHSKHRMQQRGIPPLVVDWLQEFGDKVYDHQGGIIMHFSKRSRRRLENAVGREPVRRMSEWLRAYVVKSAHEGLLITAGIRYHRIKV